MSTMTAESNNKTQSNDQTTTDVRDEIEDLKRAMEVQTATQAGIDATQVATMTGARRRRQPPTPAPGRRWSPERAA